MKAVSKKTTKKTKTINYGRAVDCCRAMGLTIIDPKEVLKRPKKKATPKKPTKKKKATKKTATTKAKKHFKYSQLSKSSKDVAAQDYVDGWLETHPEEKDDWDLDAGHDGCRDTNDEVLYDKEGHVIADSDGNEYDEDYNVAE